MKQILLILVGVVLGVVCLGFASGVIYLEYPEDTPETQETQTVDSGDTSDTSADTVETSETSKDTQGETGGSVCPRCGSSKYREIDSYTDGAGDLIEVVECVDCGEQYNINLGPEKYYN